MDISNDSSTEPMAEPFGNATNHDVTGNPSTVQYVYIVSGVLITLASISFFLLWNVFEKRSTRAPILLVQSESVTKGENVNRSTWTIVVMLALFHFFHMGLEVSYKGLVFAYSVGQLNCSRNEATWIVTVCFIAYTAGRGEIITLY